MYKKLSVVLGLALICLGITGAGFEINSTTGSFKIVGDAVPLGSYSNLLIVYTSANVVTVTVDSITLADSNNSGKVVNTVSVAPDISAAVGANGPDASGLDAVSTWRSIWVISNGTTTAGLLSASTTAPTMPSGYTYKRRVGWVKNDASSAFIPFTQRNMLVQLGGGDQQVLNTGTSTTMVDIDLSAHLPSTATMTNVYLVMASGNIGYLSCKIYSRNIVGSSASESGGYWMACSTSQVIQYKVTAGNLTLYLLGGWVDNL